MVQLDAGILMNPQVWVASGHVGGFSDPLIDDKKTGERFRADKLLENLIENTTDN
jgi:glycyl-tRNA synthetase